MKQQIQARYDYQTQQVYVTYGARIRKLFQSSSQKITEVIDEHVFSAMCDQMEDSDPRKLAAGAILLTQLSATNFMKADGEECNWALTLVAWTIFRIIDSPNPLGDLPAALTALARITPVELPAIDLPAVADVLNGYSISDDAKKAYEEIRTVGKVKFGAVPSVITAHDLWKELRPVNCTHYAFQTLLRRLDSCSLAYRTTLQALAKAQERN